MDVMLQPFYRDCTLSEGHEGSWSSYLGSSLPEIVRAGFTSLGLPTANKAAQWNSMGYDPYDYFNRGKIDHKVAMSTWCDAKMELQTLAQPVQKLNLQIYVDLLFNLDCGFVAQEQNPITGRAVLASVRTNPHLRGKP